MQINNWSFFPVSHISFVNIRKTQDNHRNLDNCSWLVIYCNSNKTLRHWSWMQFGCLGPSLFLSLFSQPSLSLQINFPVIITVDDLHKINGNIRQERQRQCHPGDIIMSSQVTVKRWTMIMLNVTWWRFDLSAKQLIVRHTAISYPSCWDLVHYVIRPTSNEWQWASILCLGCHQFVMKVLICTNSTLCYLLQIIVWLLKCLSTVNKRKSSSFTQLTKKLFVSSSTVNTYMEIAAKWT